MEVPKLRSAEKEAELDRKIQEIRRQNEILEEKQRVSCHLLNEENRLTLFIFFYFDVILIDPPIFFCHE